MKQGRRPGWRYVWISLVAAAAVLTFAWMRRSEPSVASASAEVPHVDGKRIVFTEGFAQRIGLEAIDVGRRQVTPELSVVGTVTFDPAHVVRIGARLRGVVRSVNHFEGAQVKAGAALATIDSPELAEAQAAVTSLEAENTAAHSLFLREKGLAERNLTTSRYLEEATAGADRSTALLSAAQQRLSALSGRRRASVGGSGRGLGVHVLSSPLSGTIVERHIAKGQLVEAEHVAFLVANLDHLWVELMVFERSLPYIKVKDTVELRANATSTTVVRGEVAQVGAVLNPESRGATVRVHVDNRSRQFRPGQSVNALVRAIASTLDDVTTVPSSAVIYVDGEPSVFIADGPTSVIVTSVELGATSGHEVQIKAGVETGQRVVVHGTNELRNLLFR
jgi:cobalt-zinc-cadmium efflux system membrane fusion protein